MAHIDDGGKSGRAVNVDVNIVPFIDLMSVLVIFLLITAVWTQVSMIQIGSSIYGKKSEKIEPKINDQVQIPFRVDIRSTGYHMLVGRESKSIPKVNGEYDRTRLLEELKKVKDLYPEKKDVVVTMEDDLKYEHLIAGMDALLEADFPEIAVATAGAQ